MQLHKIKIEKGQEVMVVLEEEFKKLNLTEGAIVSIIGAVDECCISNMRELHAKEDVEKVYKQPFELSGCGEIRDGKPHIHCTLSKEGDQTIHGHLHWAKVESWYVAVYVLIS
ncbi:PCC domain-containing protein [Nanoarchaeota archaeon]